MEPAKSLADIHVGIGEFKVTRNPARLVTLGLGSCVGIGIWDPVTKIGGLLHIMLPSSSEFSKPVKKAKYADLGIPMMFQELLNLGAGRSRMTAKLVGGAQMFSGLDKKQLFNVGERNIKASRQILQAMHVSITAEDVGGNKGRTMYLDVCNGQVLIKTLGKDIKVL
ncbi:MAG: chemotaxis protein CheD [Firmicutes bacterium]|nr:chemotaxis protein CheD [Bacillota bacterium]